MVRPALSSGWPLPGMNPLPNYLMDRFHPSQYSRLLQSKRRPPYVFPQTREVLKKQGVDVPCELFKSALANIEHQDDDILYKPDDDKDIEEPWRPIESMLPRSEEFESPRGPGAVRPLLHNKDVHRREVQEQWRATIAKKARDKILHSSEQSHRETEAIPTTGSAEGS